MKQALTAWLDQEEERERLTQEALADVDAGLVVDHQAVQAWADSLGTDAMKSRDRSSIFCGCGTLGRSVSRASKGLSRSRSRPFKRTHS